MRLLPIALAAAVLCGCSDDVAPPEERLRPVRYVEVSDGNAFLSRTFSGTSKSSLESRLSFKVAGTIVERPVQIGQRLSPGDTIAALDPTAYRLQVQQAEAALIEAQANDRRASANYERTKGLYANDNASLNDLDAARAQAESAEAVVEAATKALEIARLNLSYTTLKAEADCSIVSLSAEVNENVQVGQTVASVSCGDTYEVTLNLPESLIGSVDSWTPVTIEFGAIPGRYFQGEVSEVAVASTGAAAFPVVIRVLDQDPALRSGLAADVTFQFDATSDNGSDAFVLPVAAVVDGPDGTFVFVAEVQGNGQGIVRRQAVELGELTQDGIEITSGLAVGDRVVTAGTSVIRDGQRVLVPAE
jgi:RND family efflux transporter MFP subunit